MRVERIMQIGFTIQDKKLGQALIGSDPSLTLDQTRRLNITDKFIVVETILGELIFKVKKVDLSTSIVGHLSIGIVIYDSDDFNKIQAGDIVYKQLDCEL